MKVKRAGIGTKLLVLVLLVAGAIALLSMRSQLMAAQAKKDELTQQVQQQKEENAALADDIQHSSDPNYLADIARAMLGLMEPGEICFGMSMYMLLISPLSAALMTSRRTSYLSSWTLVSKIFI